MNDSGKILVKDWSGDRQENLTHERERINARLRHFRGVAAAVMSDAIGIWEEIWGLLQDSRSCKEILEGRGPSSGRMPEDERSLLMEKLHLLGIHMEYARRLCEGSIGSECQDEGEV